MEIKVNKGWRDDLRFLFELTTAFKHHEKAGKTPLINWRTLSSLNSTRWNSRGVYALIVYFLLPKWRDALKTCCEFISNTWADKWFSSQFSNPEDSYDLKEAIYVTKAKNSLNR